MIKIVDFEEIKMVIITPMCIKNKEGFVEEKQNGNKQRKNNQ